MKRTKISPGDYLEVSRLLPDSRIEIMTGEVTEKNNSSFVMKLSVTKILNLIKKEFDLVDMTSKSVPISKKGAMKIVKLEHAPNLLVTSFDDGEY